MSIWQSPPAELALGDGDVHAWRVELDQPASRVANLRNFLSADELERVDHFYFSRDRDRFIVARGLLRKMLSRYLRLRPADIAFRYGLRGKPSICRFPALQPTSFNLSHSGSLAVIGVSLRRNIGVDVEQVRSNVDQEGIAQRFFAPAEIREYLGLPAHQRTQAFFRCWTRKEAYIKATGDGLTFPLDRFVVSLAMGGRTQLVYHVDRAEVLRWTVCDLDLGSQFSAAMVVEGQNWGLQCWRLSD